MNRLVWAVDGVLSIRLRDDLFTVAQMRENSFMQFFDIRSREDGWNGIELSRVNGLFVTLVANSTRDLYERRIPKGTCVPSSEPIPQLMLRTVSVRVLRDPAPSSRGFDLVELGSGNSTARSRIVKKDLTVTDDLDLLYRYETTGMATSPAALRDRLARYFDTGVDFDDSKRVQIPDLPLPPPRRDPAGIPWYP